MVVQPIQSCRAIISRTRSCSQTAEVEADEPADGGKAGPAAAAPAALERRQGAHGRRQLLPHRWRSPAAAAAARRPRPLRAEERGPACAAASCAGGLRSSACDARSRRMIGEGGKARRSGSGTGSGGRQRHRDASSSWLAHAGGGARSRGWPADRRGRWRRLRCRRSCGRPMVSPGLRTADATQGSCLAVPVRRCLRCVARMAARASAFTSAPA